MEWESFFRVSYTVALVATIAVSLVVVLFLVHRNRAGRRQVDTEAKLLATSVAGVAVGIGAPALVSCIPDWSVTPSGAGLLFATVPVTATIFLHFCSVWAGLDLSRRGWIEVYGMAGVTLVAAIVMEVTSFSDIIRLEPALRPVMIVPQGGGWVIVAMTTALVGAAHVILFLGLHRWQGLRRRQGLAVVGANLLGLIAFSGFLWPMAGEPPVPVLLLPAYPVTLVYGVLRYRMMKVNLWARRGLLGALVGGSAMVAAGVVAAALLAGGMNSFPTALGVALVAAGSTTLVLGSAGRLATRIIYPGSAMGPGSVEVWERRLEKPFDHASLAELATTLLSAHLGHPVTILLLDHRKEDSMEDGPVFPGLEAVPPARVAQPVVVCEQGPAGWRARLVGWEDALPGPRLAVQVMAGLVTTAASRIDRILAKVELVRRETRESCLEKFGALEVVAQDLRATIDTLAVATVVPAEIRSELGVCCRQLDYLLNELLLGSVVPPPSMQEDLEVEAATEEERRAFLPPRR